MNVELIISILSSSVIASLIGAVTTIITHRKDRRTALTEGVKHLMLSDLRNKTERYIKDGVITIDDLTEFNECYIAYKKLYGNGHAETYKATVNHLPIKED